ncbi:MAG: hypothetical protein M1821_002176 [Bathelium mastoideum]|nr:MAG: hypothetical protein M1821_002176 [Bathelium mastoideum]KAI9685054.1 MAG: hypothetical protein M1822_005446 [Bathelium mastoideum]
MPPRKSTHNAFFYGTLMVPGILNRVIQNPAISIPSSRTATTPALLAAFRRHRVRHADYPAILPSPDDSACVRGTLVSGLSDADMIRLDRFEGTEYKRQVVEVQILSSDEESSNNNQFGGKAMVQAETYVWIAGKHQLEEREWDFEEFRREKMGRWLGRHSTEYRDVEKQTQTSGDDNADPTRGRGPDGAIGKALEGDQRKAKGILDGAV